MREKSQETISKIKKLYASKKSTSIAYFIIFGSFIFFCIPGILYYLKCEKYNLDINKKINEILNKNKNDNKLQEFNKTCISDYYLKEKKIFFYFFLFFFICFTICLIIILVLLARK